MMGASKKATLQERFEQFEEDFCNFDEVSEKRSGRADLHAFLLLDSLLPGKSDMVSAAEHDEIFLDVDCDALNEKISDTEILELVRCGVRFGDFDCLAMFV